MAQKRAGKHAKYIKMKERLDEEDLEEVEPDVYKPRATPAKPETVPGCFDLVDTIWQGKPHKKPRINQKGLDLIEQMSADTYGDRLIACALGLTYEQYVTCKNQDDRIPEALATGKERLEVRFNKFILHKIDKGDMLGGIFGTKLLTKRNPEKEPPPPPPQNVHFHLTLRDAMSPEQYMKDVVSTIQLPNAPAQVETTGETVKETPKALPEAGPPKMPDWLSSIRGAAEERIEASSSPKPKPEVVMMEDPLSAAQRMDPVR